MLVLHGPEKTKEILRKLKVIFISHEHGDHSTGIYTLLSKRQEALMYGANNVRITAIKLSFLPISLNHRVFRSVTTVIVRLQLLVSCLVIFRTRARVNYTFKKSLVSQQLYLIRHRS